MFLRLFLLFPGAQPSGLFQRRAVLCPTPRLSEHMELFMSLSKMDPAPLRGETWKVSV